MSTARQQGMDQFDSVREQSRLEIVDLVTRIVGNLEGSMETAVAGLHLYRMVRPSSRHSLQKPIFAMIAQGSKRLLVGDEIYRYDPMHYLVSSVDLPVLGKIMCSSGEPYLGLRLDLDVGEITRLIRDENLPQAPALKAAASTRGLYVSGVSPTLLDAVLRLLRLLDTPQDIPILAPLIKREILYRLLMNGQGALLRQIAMQDSQMQRVAKVIRILNENLTQPLRMEDIARSVHMSVSSLHHHFKAVTAMSPLQYQKQLRLQQARELVLTADIDVTRVAHTVGYESPSQFSREYSRFFGMPPLRDRRRWLQETAAA
ncbi:MAG TPA: AraC family transcriptional regulator [Oxalicibacterium sp.]|nr:AraC family transcriptional regulator [Oxalicibacterium sp.]